MNALRDKKIRFSDAADAIEATPKSLRKWLQHPGFSLLYEPPAGAWIAFSFADLGMLAITRKLVDFGVGVPVANDMARRVVSERLASFERFKNPPPDSIVSAFIGHRLVVWIDGGELFFSVLYGGDDDFPEASAYLVVDLESVVSAAINRVLLNEGA